MRLVRHGAGQCPALQVQVLQLVNTLPATLQHFYYAVFTCLLHLDLFLFMTVIQSTPICCLNETCFFWIYNKAY